MEILVAIVLVGLVFAFIFLELLNDSPIIETFKEFVYEKRKWNDTYKFIRNIKEVQYNER